LRHYHIMRAVIFLTIVGVTLGSDNVGICETEGISNDTINAVWSKVRTGATAIFGQSCGSFNIDSLVFSGKCEELARQATCYGLNAEKRYRVDVVDYSILADDVDNIKYLGKLACSHAGLAGCFEKIRRAIQTCEDNNENFVRETIKAAEVVYRTDFEAEVRAFADKKSGSILGDLASMVLHQFSSAEDIQTFIASYISEDVQAEVEAAGNKTLDMAKEWCKKGCNTKSAKYLKNIFSHMHESSGCNDTSVFCGRCAKRASYYITRRPLPCCIDNVIKKGIEIYNNAEQKYSETLAEYTDGLLAKLKPEALEKAEAVRNSFNEQFDCVKDVYNGITNKPVCA